MQWTKIPDGNDKGQFIEVQISEELKFWEYSLGDEIVDPVREMETCIHLPQNIMLPRDLGHLLFFVGL